MRPVWTGGISFGLIFIPVKMYTAVSTVEIDLDLLSKKEKHPIRYARIDKVTGKEVAWMDVVKGFAVKKGDYVVLDDEDFEKVALHRSETIEVVSFVDKEEIDPMLFEKPYYLEPDKGASKTYYILLKALEKTGKVGVAEFIFKNREHVCCLTAENGMIILNQMRYAAELKEAKELDIPKSAKVSDKELNLAVRLVEEMSDKFDPKDYTDDYLEALQKIIAAKKSKKHVKVKQLDKPDATDVSKIIDQLEKSLKEYSR